MNTNLFENGTAKTIKSVLKINNTLKTLSLINCCINDESFSLLLKGLS